MKKYTPIPTEFTIQRPERVWEIQLDEPNMDKLLLEEINKVGDQQGYKTNAKCLMTYWQMWEYPGFKRFADIFLKAVDYISRKEYNENHQYKFCLKNLWGIKVQKNEEVIAHDHWPAIYSCAYYVTAPEGAPGISFPEVKTKEGLGVTKRIRPGLLLVFPGWMRHSVEKKDFEGDRYVVSSNAYADKES